MNKIIIPMKYFFLAILLFVGFSSYAQQQGCATPPVKSDWLSKYQQNPSAYRTSPATLYVPLTIHLVGNDQGNGYFSLFSLMNAFCTLQNDFAASDIQFYIEEIRYIDNDNYYEHTFGQGAQMMNINNVNGTINCYVVSDPAGACGYYSPSEEAVALGKSCMGVNDHTWAHEIGHFLTLPHTFLGWEGTDYDPLEATPSFVGFRPVERLDGSNCEDAADGFCDTPADYLSYRWPCNNENLSSQLQKDPTGEEFRSDGTLFMSYANDNCSSRFSDEQIGAMRANLLGPRSFLLDDQTPLTLIGDATPDLLYPIQEELVENVSSFELNWEAVPNADGYIVDLDAVLPAGNFNIGNYETTETNATVSGLVSNKEYQWRVRPYSFEDGCTQFSEFETFFTGELLSSTREIPGLSHFNLFPVPQQAGQVLNLAWSMERSSEMQMRLMSLTGQVLYSEAFFVPAGANRRIVSTQNLPAGVYMLVLENEMGSSRKKVVLR